MKKMCTPGEQIPINEPKEKAIKLEVCDTSTRPKTAKMSVFLEF